MLGKTMGSKSRQLISNSFCSFLGLCLGFSACKMDMMIAPLVLVQKLNELKYGKRLEQVVPHDERICVNCIPHTVFPCSAPVTLPLGNFVTASCRGDSHLHSVHVRLPFYPQCARIHLLLPLTQNK